MKRETLSDTYVHRQMQCNVSCFVHDVQPTFVAELAPRVNLDSYVVAGHTPYLGQSAHTYTCCDEINK